MLPIFANLTFNTAPTVFPISVSVSDPQLIRTVRHELEQAELEPGSEHSIFRSSTNTKTASTATTMNRPITNINASASSNRRRSRAVPTSNDDEARQPAPTSTTAPQAPSVFLTGLIDRMFCCSYSGTVPPYGGVVDDDDDDDMVVVVNGLSKKVPSPLNGSHFTDKALDNFPAIERARKVRSSTPTSFSWNSMKDWGSGSFAPVPPTTSPNKKFFVLDEKPDDHKKRLNFYKQEEATMTRTSTATTASMERSASVSSAASSSASLQSWNTLPTQPSEDESSCRSAPSRRRGGARSSKHSKGNHQRRLTDPQLAEQLLMQQLRDKLLQHEAATATTGTSNPAVARSVYHHQLPVE